jgi:two-component system sensor histidine kinase DctS
VKLKAFDLSTLLRNRSRVVAVIVAAALVWAGVVAALFALAEQNERSRTQLALKAEATETAQLMRSRLLSLQTELELIAAQQRKAQVEDAESNAAAPLPDLVKSILAARPEIARVERRDAFLGLQKATDSAAVTLGALSVRSVLGESTTVACESALRTDEVRFSESFFVPVDRGLGFENIDICLANGSPPMRNAWVMSVSLTGLLRSIDPELLARHGEVYFADADGARLATLRDGSTQRVTASATAVISLPGTVLSFGINSRVQPFAPYPSAFAAIAGLFSLLLFVSVLFLARDVLRRQRAERALSQSLAFRKAMEDATVVGLRARDLQGRITYVNPAFCEIVGLPQSKLIGCAPPMPYWPPEARPEYERRLARRMAGALQRDVYETELMRPGGTRVPVLIHEAPLYDAQEVHVGWMASVLDVSEQRRVESVARAQQDKLAEASRLTTVGELASTLSHELNQPLAAIASFAAAGRNMLAAGSSTAEIAPLMQDIAAQAERAGRVIKSVRNFVQRGERKRELIDMSQLARDIAPLVTLQARGAKVTVQWDVPNSLPPVQADKILIEQVLLNLTRNGAEAMQSLNTTPKLLRVSLCVQDGTGSNDTILVSVYDSGHGIDASTEQAMYTPFYTTKTQGMGLGLSICRNVIEQHAGRLWFDRLSPQGTAFRFTLPLAAQPSTQQTQLEATAI